MRCRDSATMPARINNAVPMIYCFLFCSSRTAAADFLFVPDAFPVLLLRVPVLAERVCVDLFAVFLPDVFLVLEEPAVFFAAANLTPSFLDFLS